MMESNTLYIDLIESVFRINNWDNKTPNDFNKNVKNAEEFIFKFIIENVDASIIRKILIKTNQHDSNQLESLNVLLNNYDFEIEAIKLLTLMEASKNINDFKKLNSIRSNNTKKEHLNNTDFDKLISAFIKVPKSDILKNTSQK